MGVFDMTGEIDYDFDTGQNCEHQVVHGTYVDGKWEENIVSKQVVQANIQPVSEREIAFLTNGGERIVDARKLYVTEDIPGLSLSSRFVFLGQVWRVFRFDSRPENSYHKILVGRVDA